MSARKLLSLAVATLSTLLLISLYFAEQKNKMSLNNDWEKIKESRNRTEEELLWPILHEPQKQNTGFIHLYQQMITGGPFGEKRHQEIVETIQYNIDHIHVRYLYMAIETGNETRVYKEKLRDPHGKVKFIPFGRQSKYSDVFAHIMNHIYPKLQKDEVWMLANSDIALGEGFDMLKGKLDIKTILVLSRYDKFCSDLNMCFESGGGSTDCVVGSSRVKEETYKHYNFKHYARGGESEIMRYLRKAGFTVINPCIDIKTYHNHCSGDRSWGKDKREWKKVNPVETYTPSTRWRSYVDKLDITRHL